MGFMGTRLWENALEETCALLNHLMHALTFHEALSSESEIKYFIIGSRLRIEVFMVLSLPKL
jgi:hypothetical protein